MAELWTEQIAIPAHLLFQEVDDEAVLLDLERGHYFGLDEVGTRIWRLLGEHSTLPEVYRALLRAGYAVDEGELEHDLEGFVGELAAAGLIELGCRP
ncbi:MAG: PqqD family protein, partial [Thermoanaerobaculia bacterium]